jgi:hypothetical protein
MDDVAKLWSTLRLPDHSIAFSCKTPGSAGIRSCRRPDMDMVRHGPCGTMATSSTLMAETLVDIAAIDDSEDEGDRTSGKREWTIRH